MSKELTEKWRNGTLPENWYYIHLKSDWGGIDCITINYCDEDGVFEEYPDEDIKEILAPVPRFYEYNELVQKIHLLNEANMKLENTVGKLCEQLKEANYAIKHYKYCSSGFKVDKEGSVIDKFIARSYLDKWGVK